MAAETHHTSAVTDHEVLEKNENEEAIGQKIVSISNENEDKQDKAEHAQSPATATSLSKREGEDTKIDGDDSPSLEASLAETPKHDQDKTEDEQGQGLSVPLSGTESKPNEEDKKVEAATTEVEKTDDSPESEAFPADNLKHNKAEAEPDVAEVGKTDDSLAPEPSAKDNQKEEKVREVIPDSSEIICASNEESQSQDIQPAESTVENSDSAKEPEKESIETDNIPQAPAEEIIEMPSNPIEVTPLTESEEVLEETEYSQTNPENIDKQPDIVGTEVKERDKSEEPEKGHKEQPSTVVDTEPLVETETIERPSDVIVEKPREAEFDAGVVKETSKYEAGSTETEEPESVVTEIEEKPSEKEEKLDEKVQPEQGKTVTPGTTAETFEKPCDAIEDHTSKESDNDNSEAVPDEAEKQESTSSEGEEKPKQSEAAEEVTEKDKDEKTMQELEGENASHEENSNVKIKDLISLKEEKTQEEEETTVTESSEQVSLKEEAQAAPANGAEVKSSPDITENVVEEVKRTQEEEETTLTESSEQISLKEEAQAALTNEVKRTQEEEETTVTESSEQVSQKEEAQAALTNGDEAKSSIVSAEKVVAEDEKSREVEGTTLTESSKQVSSKEEAQAALANGTEVKSSPDITENVEEVKKTQEEEETTVMESSEQVSLKEEAQAALANGAEVKPSPGIAENVVEEDDKKESSKTDEVEVAPKQVALVLENPEQVSINQGAQTDVKENTEASTPPSVEEKDAANDNKKEATITDAAIELSREAEVETKRAEESDEANTDTAEEGYEKVASVKDDQPVVNSEKDGSEETKVNEVTTEISESPGETPASKFKEKEEESNNNLENLEKQQNAADSKKDGNTETKVDEVTAVSEPIRETLASKLEEKEEESIKTGGENLEKQQKEDTVKTEVQTPEPLNKEGDTIKTSRDLPKETPAKPAKQSNNIISKVKQSLVKAKKAITGKSPSSKTISSEAKGDIKVK